MISVKACSSAPLLCSFSISCGIIPCGILHPAAAMRSIIFFADFKLPCTDVLKTSTFRMNGSALVWSALLFFAYQVGQGSSQPCPHCRSGQPRFRDFSSVFFCLSDGGDISQPNDGTYPDRSSGLNRSFQNCRWIHKLFLPFFHLCKLLGKGLFPPRYHILRSVSFPPLQCQWRTQPPFPDSLSSSAQLTAFSQIKLAG